MPDRRLMLAGLGLALSANALAAVTVELQRPFGYLVGDVITQRVTFDHQHGLIDSASLPKPGYQTPWLYLRRAQIDKRSDSQQLTLDYQVMSTSPEVTLIYLPTLKLKSDQGSERVDAVPVSVSALTTKQPMQVAGMGDLQPDQLVPVASATERVDRLRWLVPFLLIIAVALLWRRRWLKNQGSALPFAHASRQIAKMSGRHADSAGADLIRDAHQQLHRAFDGCAGKRLFVEGLDEFLVDRPSYQQEKDAIAEFFQSSSQLFFGRAQAEADTSAQMSLDKLKHMAKRLARLERAGL